MKVWSKKNSTKNMKHRHGRWKELFHPFFGAKKICSILPYTVDGRNPAPPGMYKTLSIMG